MVYKPGTHTLAHTGLTADNKDHDKGFAKLRAAVLKLQAGGIEVFISMGGWDYNCFPYMYARYTIGGYAAKGPNFWKIEKYAVVVVSFPLSVCPQLTLYFLLLTGTRAAT